MPSSSILTLAPVFSTISRITLPPVPITSRILSVGIFICSIRGANSPSSARAPEIAFAISPRMCMRPCFAWASATLHDLLGDAGDLDVHLQRSDALGGAGDFEVHVAEVVLVAEDVGEHRVALAFEDEAHGDACGRAFDRHAGVHQRQRRAADGRHRRGAVRLGDLRDDADRVGELRRRRQHGMDRAPGELAMADLAPSGRTHAAGLADRIGREVIVQQEALLVGAFQRVDELLVFAGAERRDHQRLGLAAGEQRRAVRARQHADLAEDRADRGQVAPVDAAAVVEDVPAHHFGLQRCGRPRRPLRRRTSPRPRPGRAPPRLSPDGVDGRVALLLLR